MTNSNGSKIVYGLTIEVLGKSPIIEITQDEFNLVRNSMNLLIDALCNEESLNLILENYIEYENELFNSALRALVQRPQSWSEFNEKIYEINRRVVNLLSGCRGYIDQTKHFLSTYYGSDSDEFKKFNDWAQVQYKERLGYRAMEALRNSAQHRGIAVHSLSYDNWRCAEESQIMIIRNSVSPFIHTDILAEDIKFKKSVLDELMEIGKKINLRPLLNGYVAGIVNLHLNVRKSISSRVNNADEFIKALISKYKRDAQDDCLGLIVAKFDEDGRRIDKAPIFDDHIARRKILEKITKHAPVIEKIYTTNELREK